MDRLNLRTGPPTIIRTNHLYPHVHAHIKQLMLWLPNGLGPGAPGGFGIHDLEDYITISFRAAALRSWGDKLGQLPLSMSL